jgi:hypothetical protein
VAHLGLGLGSSIRVSKVSGPGYSWAGLFSELLRQFHNGSVKLRQLFFGRHQVLIHACVDRCRYFFVEHAFVRDIDFEFVAELVDKEAAKSVLFLGLA